MNESNYRQKLLILYLGNASLNSDVGGWSLYDGTTDEELDLVKALSEEAGAAAVAKSTVYQDGGDGGIELAEAVVDNVTGEKPNIKYMYEVEDSLENKIGALARGVYNAEGVNFNLSDRRALREFSNNGWSKLPICMAKTHLSLSHNRSLKGLPSEYTFRVSDARASVGAGFIYPIAGNIMTMPGLPGSPRQLDVDDKGNILGL